MYQKESPETLQTLFGSIAPRYDRANAVLSFGMHSLWNRALVKALHSSHHLLDLCAGTGAIALSFLEKNPQAKATLLDFCPEMLAIANQRGSSFPSRFSSIVADAQNLPFENASFDAISVAYGIRNVNDPKKCFEEAYRVLKSDGIFCILELTRPTFRILRQGHALYLRTLLPLLGKWVANDHAAYQYLSKSVSAFVLPVELAQTLKASGFSSVHIKPLMGGIATLLTCKK